MNRRKNIFARTICLAATLITFAFFAFGCGSAAADATGKEDTQGTEKIQETEEVVNIPTEAAPQIESEAAEQPEEAAEPTELPKKPEKEVICRITISNERGALVSSYPNSFEYETYLIAEYGTCFDVYDVVEDDFEYEYTGDLYYEVEVDGKTGYIYVGNAQIIE